VRQTAADRVFATLRAGILSGELAAGARYSIYRLADDLGVSRTPVREAVLRLADAGLVSIERNRGVRVRGVTAEDVREVFELRLMVEVPAAAHAARVADDDLVAALAEASARLHSLTADADAAAFDTADRELHALIASALRNAYVLAEIERLRDLIRVRGASTIGRSRSKDDIAGEHDPIIEAIRRRDADAAARAMRAHLVRTGTLLMRQVSGREVDDGWAERVSPAE